MVVRFIKRRCSLWGWEGGGGRSSARLSAAWLARWGLKWICFIDTELVSGTDSLVDNEINTIDSSMADRRKNTKINSGYSQGEVCFVLCLVLPLGRRGKLDPRFARQ